MIVVGAGIGGLTAATSLRRAGHIVKVGGHVIECATRTSQVLDGRICTLKEYLLNITCQIFEQSRLKEEIGAALHVCCNASRCLLKLGLQVDRLRPSICQGVGFDSQIFEDIN